MNIKLIIQSEDNSLRIYDWIAFILLAGLCFFTMQSADILHTAGSSFSLLNGHILDFYEYNAQYLDVNNYMISTYVLFAIWNIPIRLLGIVTMPTMNVPYGVLMWYKALPTLFFMASAILIYFIAREVGFDSNKSKIASYAFVTMPIAFFSQFIFGQYDIFTVFFMLLGIYFYFKNEKNSMLLFSLFFGIACTFKYFALLIYLPMLFLKRKTISKIIVNGVCLVVPIVIVFVPYITSSAFRNGVLGFYATANIFDTTIGGDLVQLSLVPIAFIVLCIYALFKDEFITQTDLFIWTIFLNNIVFFICFGLAMWNPQWLLMAVPFWTFGLLNSKRIDISCLLDILLMAFFSVYVVNRWSNHVDQQLFNLGAFQSMMGEGKQTLMMHDVYKIKDIRLIRSCFTGILAASTLIKHPQYCFEDLNHSVKNAMGWLKARFLVGISIFLLPMFICLLSEILR